MDKAAHLQQLYNNIGYCKKECQQPGPKTGEAYLFHWGQGRVRKKGILRLGLRDGMIVVNKVRGAESF